MTIITMSSSPPISSALPRVDTMATLSAEKRADQADLRALLEKNIALSESIALQNKKIQRRLTIMVVGSYLKLAFILIPLILAFLFLPPVIESAWDQYAALLGNRGGGENNADVTGLQQLLQSLQ